MIVELCLLFFLVILIGKLFHKFKGVKLWVLIVLGIVGLGGVSLEQWIVAKKRSTTVQQQVVNQEPVEGTVYEESPPSFSVEELFNLTNERRVEAGRKSLLLDPVLNDSAQAKCEDMVMTGIWDHGNWKDYIPDSRRYRGENLALGYLSEKEVVDAWSLSAEHYKNLVNEQFERVGFGICIQDNQVSIVQHFSD